MAFGLILSLIITLILIPISALILKLTAKIFQLENTNYRTALKITFILAILWLVADTLMFYIPSLTIIIYLISATISIMWGLRLIKSNYNIETGKATWILAVWSIFSFIIGGLVIFLLTIMIGIIGLGILFGG